jgi:hypothetical protein
VRQLKQLQEENTPLKQLVAELSLDKTMLQDLLAKKFVAMRTGGRASVRPLQRQRTACL